MSHTQINYKKEDEDLILRLSIARISFLRAEEKIFFQKNIDNPHMLALLSIEEIEKKLNRTVSKRAKWNGEENLEFAVKTLVYCRRLGIKTVFIDDESYPSLLKEISDPPYLLFCRGNVQILNDNSVSVVGTRNLTAEGRNAAFSFAYDVAKNGCCVVSGLARGADGYAHQGAVDAYFDCVEKNLNPSDLGKTIAVLPSGIDSIVPLSHKKLAERILASGGCIISEYEPGMGTANWQFVARNRIIAALSQSVVVIEAPAGSGALITADFALDYGRDVFFHKAAFSDAAKIIADNTRLELTKAHALGEVSKYKLENTPQKFLEAGAPVINDYADFCTALTEAPGTRTDFNLNKNNGSEEFLF